MYGIMRVGPTRYGPGNARTPVESGVSPPREFCAPATVVVAGRTTQDSKRNPIIKETHMKDRMGKLTLVGLLGAGLFAGSWVQSARAGDILVADCLGHQVHRVSENGDYLGKFVPRNGGGLAFPHNMVWGPDRNNDGHKDVYIAGLQSRAVHLYDGKTGAPINGGIFANRRLSNPVDLDFGPDRNNDGVPDLYVLNNSGRDRVVWFDGKTGALGGRFIDRDAGGNYNAAEFMFFGPDVTDDGVPELYATSQANGIIYRFNGATGQYIDRFLNGGAGYISGRDLIFHTDGKLYIANGGGNSIVRFNALTGQEGEVFVAVRSGGLSNPHGMMFGPDANNDGVADLFVASQANASVICYDGVTGDLIKVLVEPGLGGMEAAASLLFTDDASSTGDLNCDGSIDLTDVSPFITALLNPSEYEKQYPNCDINNADTNDDGSVDLTDVEGFIGLLLG